MSLKKFIQRQSSSLFRKKRKRDVIKTIINSSQSNNDVVNLHRIDANNVGDFYCAPHLYFNELKGKQLDIFDYKSLDKNITENWISKICENSLIIGGGGLLNRNSFEMQINLFQQLHNKGKKTVLWGAGHNSKSKDQFGKINSYNIDPLKFGLVGVRDFNMRELWVPCVSCMHPIFDKSFDETQEIGIIFHKKTIKNKKLLGKLDQYPSTSNTTDLDHMISFIGASQTIVTDSYHAMYWSMLLGKKVVAIPNSSKFFDFKYHPIYSSFDNFESDLNKTHSYSGVLKECRDINLKFADKVFDFLNL